LLFPYVKSYFELASLSNEYDYGWFIKKGLVLEHDMTRGISTGRSQVVSWLGVFALFVRSA
jgi:hypothetical protein